MPQPPEASLSTPPERMHFAEPPAHVNYEFHQIKFKELLCPCLIKCLDMQLFEDIHSRIGSQSMPTSIEKLASPEKVHNNVMLPEANGLSASKANLMATPGISGMLMFIYLWQSQ